VSGHQPADHDRAGRERQDEHWLTQQCDERGGADRPEEYQWPAPALDEHGTDCPLLHLALQDRVGEPDISRSPDLSGHVHTPYSADRAPAPGAGPPGSSEGCWSAAAISRSAVSSRSTASLADSFRSSRSTGSSPIPGALREPA